MVGVDCGHLPKQPSRLTTKTHMEGHEAILKVSTSALQSGLKTRELTEQSHGIETIMETGSTTRGPQEIKADGDGTENWTSRPLAILFLTSERIMQGVDCSRRTKISKSWMGV